MYVYSFQAFRTSHLEHVPNFNLIVPECTLIFYSESISIHKHHRYHHFIILAYFIYIHTANCLGMFGRTGGASVGGTSLFGGGGNTGGGLFGGANNNNNNAGGGLFGGASNTLALAPMGGSMANPNPNHNNSLILSNATANNNNNNSLMTPVAANNNPNATAAAANPGYELNVGKALEVAEYGPWWYRKLIEIQNSYGMKRSTQKILADSLQRKIQQLQQQLQSSYGAGGYGSMMMNPYNNNNNNIMLIQMQLQQYQGLLNILERRMLGFGNKFVCMQYDVISIAPDLICSTGPIPPSYIDAFKFEKRRELANKMPWLNQELWVKAEEKNPDPTNWVPVPVIGIEAFNQRVKLQTNNIELQLQMITSSATSVDSSAETGGLDTPWINQIDTGSDIDIQLQSLKKEHERLSHRLLRAQARLERLKANSSQLT